MEARLESLRATLATEPTVPDDGLLHQLPDTAEFPEPFYDNERRVRPDTFSRSASQPTISSQAKRKHTDDMFSFSEEDLIPGQSSWTTKSSCGPFDSYAASHDLSPSSSTLYSKSPEVPADSKITVSRAVLISEQQRLNQSLDPAEESATATIRSQSPPRPRGLSRTFTNFSSRKPRLSRTSSPEKIETATKKYDASKDSERPHTSGSKPSLKRRSWRTQDTSASSSGTDDTPSGSLPSRSRSLLNRHGRGYPTPFTSLFKTTGSDSSPQRPLSPKRPATPLPKSFSNSSLPSMSSSGGDAFDVPPLPGTMSLDTYKPATIHIPKKKDELWNAFRALDGDFQKFQSKSIALKPNVVRSCLIPFLRAYADHPSNRTLRPEDLDRRAVILNKWWSGLLDVLNGKNNQSLSGTDRPNVLDAISGIMERPEWRIAPSSFCPIVERLATSEPSNLKSALTSPSSEFLLESVHHNVRNMFVQNLFAQIVYSVEKMSSRQAPASLVAFCGKACAYAFFFCPGIAEILVRLWNVKSYDMGRVLEASGIGRSTSLHHVCEEINSNFPHCLRSLGFVSVKETSLLLRTQPVLPLGVDKIQWHGHWTNRWSGRDSEFFYVFAKHFFLLSADFLPPNASKEEYFCAPAMVLVQAQMLTNLDATIHRQTNQAAAAELSTDNSLTFDDLLSSDGAAIAMPALPANASRLMAENRLIMLLHDFLMEKDRPDSPSNHIFAQSFCDVLKASAQSTSLYDHNACFTLCDFLQEALEPLIRFQTQAAPNTLPFDWDFWFDVLKKMVQSQNTTTDIRVYALIFSMWFQLTSKETWKTRLCLDFLLDQQHFLETFCHWCPMVRAYYMRLLCWRVARYDGDASDGDVEILKTLITRLQVPWAHFKFYHCQAQQGLGSVPSTAPCNPAPSRKLLIIRTDTPTASSLMHSFNSMVPSVSRRESDAIKQSSNNGSSDSFFSSPGGLLEKVTATFDTSGDSSKRKNGLFRSLLGYRSTEHRSRSQSPHDKNDDPRQASPPRTSTPASRNISKAGSPDRFRSSRSSMYESRPSHNQQRQKSESANGDEHSASRASPQQSLAYFKFSLEVVDRRPTAVPLDMTLEPPRLPLAAQLLLSTIPSSSSDNQPRKPGGYPSGASRYCGRALAEWTLVVNECQNFFERRRNEGVPANKLVETPTLGVESFRRPG